MNDPVIVKHLKRINEDITEVLAKYGHVALYRLRRLDLTEEWEREQFEGGFYIFKKNPALPAHQRCGMCILNRLSTSDLVEDISNNFEFEFKERFLIYRRGSEIRAIWFADDADAAASSLPDEASTSLMTTTSGEGGEGPRIFTNFDAIKACLERIKREITSIPPVPLHSLPRRRDPQTGFLTKEEMRDGVLRLMNDSKFVDTLYAQLLATEERKRRNASGAGGNPIANLLSTAGNVPPFAMPPPPPQLQMRYAHQTPINVRYNPINTTPSETMYSPPVMHHHHHPQQPPYYGVHAPIYPAAPSPQPPPHTMVSPPPPAYRPHEHQQRY